MTGKAIGEKRGKGNRWSEDGMSKCEAILGCFRTGPSTKLRTGREVPYTSGTLLGIAEARGHREHFDFAPSGA